MSPCLLVQPSAGGMISGGYLYNARMADHGAWRVVDVEPSQLSVESTRLPSSGLVLVDSLFLAPQYAEGLASLRQRGLKLGLLLHSFPSLIEAVDRHGVVRTEPTEYELSVVRGMCCVVVPGPHYGAVLQRVGAAVVMAEPGLEEAWRMPPRRRAGPCKLISVGSVTPRKGFVDVAEVLAQRSTEDYAWTVVGRLDADPAYTRKLQSACAGVGAVQLLGQCEPARVRQLVGTSDVLVMPSYDENQPLVLLEAMAASVPVIAYRAGAASEMVADGDEGLLVPVGDRVALAAALNRVIRDAALHSRLSAACWTRQATIPNWSDTAERTRERLDAFARACTP